MRRFAAPLILLLLAMLGVAPLALVTHRRSAAGGNWHRLYVDLTAALQGKRSAILTLRLIDGTSLSL